MIDYFSSSCEHAEAKAEAAAQDLGIIDEDPVLRQCRPQDDKP